ncbi:hypothetical protein [Lacipirellula parvula]|uniref:Uncharacterized protein n=1 Tax=Lacipirellula parvula TaxID=2650471 RepID=A0A5K7XNR8_9BACT|nr:hypothetical protein [Lacipirellula parvula]BBO36543.1 hypothetical protein PLANPX_6155 [Lacipirellula parvula]
MKIQQKDLFHGAALTQLTEHVSFKALNKADAKYGHYMVNTDRRLMVKLTEKTSAPWTFTFQPDDLNTISSDIASGFRTFIVLVCGKVTICLLSEGDFSQLIDLTSPTAQWIKVEIPKASMRVRGSHGTLKGAITHNSFPDGVF